MTNMPSNKCLANEDRLKGKKIKIYPTEKQKTKIQRQIEIYRAVYNIGLELQIRNKDEGNKYIQYFDMCKIFANMRNNDPKYEWLKEASIGVIRESLSDLDTAFMKFFKKLNRFPKFKTRKFKKSFTTRADRTKIKGSKIQLSGFGNDLIEAKKHHIDTDVPIHSPTVTFNGYDNYYFSCTYERDKIDMSDVPKTEAVGIDVGIRNMITTSDGDFYHFSDTSKIKKRIKRCQRKVQKDYNRYLEEANRTRTKYEDVPKSKNHQKRLAKQWKLINKVTNKRHNDINIATKQIVSKNPEAIVIEDIKVTQIIRDNPFMKKYKPQMCFCEIHRQLKYKAEERDIPVIVAPRDYASTQLCSNCGCMNTIGIGKHVFKCRFCGFVIDRDLNASINLKKLAYRN